MYTSNDVLDMRTLKVCVFTFTELAQEILLFEDNKDVGVLQE